MHWVHVHSVLIHFKFCPESGVRSFSSGRCETTTTPFSLPNFQTFKSQKESRRKTLFARKTPAGRKKRKFDDESTWKWWRRGMWTNEEKPCPWRFHQQHLPKIFSRFIHSQSEYKLAFKDGSEAKHIPGIGPNRLFTLRRYKGESRLGYGPITLFLRPEGGIFKELRRSVDEDDDLLCDSAKSATKDSSDDEDFTKSD